MSDQLLIKTDEKEFQEIFDVSFNALKSLTPAEKRIMLEKLHNKIEAQLRDELSMREEAMNAASKDLRDFLNALNS